MAILRDEIRRERVPLRRHDNMRQSALMAKLISRSICQMARVTLVYWTEIGRNVRNAGLSILIIFVRSSEFAEGKLRNQ